jgi:hypothetical protein
VVIVASTDISLNRSDLLSLGLLVINLDPDKTMLFARQFYLQAVLFISIKTSFSIHQKEGDNLWG